MSRVPGVITGMKWHGTNQGLQRAYSQAWWEVMGTNGQLFPLTDNTDGAAVDQVQQQHLFISGYNHSGVYDSRSL
jgi:hypothetical protein